MTPERKAGYVDGLYAAREAIDEEAFTQVGAIAQIDELIEAARLAAPSTPEPLEVCPRCGRFSSHDHDVAPSTPEPSDWEPPMGTKCPNCGFSFRYDPSDTYRNHRCPSTPEPSGPVGTLARIHRKSVKGNRCLTCEPVNGGKSWPCATSLLVAELRAAPSTEPAPVEGDADFDATATDYRRGSPQYAPSTEPALDALRDIGRLAIAHVEAMEADWLEAKEAHETDDDLEQSWVTFRNEVRRLARLAESQP